MDQLRNIRFGAVALGVVVDKLSFFILAGGLVAILATSSTAFSVSALLVGTACTTLGAYVAARRARIAFLLHGFLVAGVAFAISFARFVAFTLKPPDDPHALHPWWWELLGWSLLAGACFLGGSLARRRVQGDG